MGIPIDMIKKFSLVIPCYNESLVLPHLIKRCKGVLDNPKVEVILVDNGSTDNTSSILKKQLSDSDHFRSIKVEDNKGYGHGILAGLKAAEGDIIGYTHADLQTDPIDFIRGIKLFNRYGKNIFVKGRRYGRPIADIFFTVGMGLFETVLLRSSMWDINAQPTLFSRSFFESWPSPPFDFSLDLYIYYLAKKQKIPVHRFPVKFEKRMYGRSHWNIDWASKRRFIKRTIDFSLKLKRNISL